MACPFDKFCLGMCDWTDCPGLAMMENTPTVAQPQPSCSSHTSNPSSTLHHERQRERFTTFVNDDELAVLSKGVVPASTDKSTRWALANFSAWKKARNEKYPSNPVPENLFASTDPATLCTHLSRFVLETRKANGECYPPKTLHQLLCGLLRHMRETNPGCPNFLDKKDSRFKTLHGTMDSQFHHLHSTGIGREVKHARVLTKEDEDRLWRTGVMGTTTPKALQNAAFYTVGKMFSLRGGVEMRNLKISQIQRHTNPDRYVYTELVSKTSNGTFKKLHVANKTVPLFACPEAGEHCPVHILDLYLNRLPQAVIEDDVFFVKPLENVTNESTKPWYSRTPVGRNTLDTKLGKMCSLAGIEGRVTNHSMRATSVTQMYSTGVPEKVIQERTGHRSLEALRVYERTNTQQHQMVSNILSAPSENTQIQQTQTKHSIMQTHSSHSVMSIEPPSNQQSVHISLENLHGCTININNNTIPQSAQNPSVPPFNLSQAEIDELFADF